MEELGRDDIVLVNGAAGGIGKATVEAFLGAGARVVGIDRAQSVEGLCQGEYLGVQASLEDDRAVREAVEKARDSVGRGRRLRHVVCIAGGADPREAETPRFSELSMAVVEDLVRQNFTNQYRFAQITWPWLSRERGVDRSLTFTGSINGLTGYRQPVYGAMKAAFVNLAQSLAGMLGPEGVRVNVVAPGATATRWWESVAPASSWPRQAGGWPPWKGCTMIALLETESMIELDKLLDLPLLGPDGEENLRKQLEHATEIARRLSHLQPSTPAAEKRAKGASRPRRRRASA